MKSPVNRFLTKEQRKELKQMFAREKRFIETQAIRAKAIVGEKKLAS